MAWNEKALKQIKPKTAKMDAFDIEAEREGNATRYFKRNEIAPQTLGRRISKESRKTDGYAKTAELKATQNLVEDTANRARGIIVPQYSLRQG